MVRNIVFVPPAHGRPSYAPYRSSFEFRSALIVEQVDHFGRDVGGLVPTGVVAKWGAHLVPA